MDGREIIILMSAVIVPMMCSRFLTVGGGLLMMGERFGTGNLAGGMVNACTWVWMDGALLHHLRRESTAYEGVLLDTDVSMKWHRPQKKQR